MFRNLMYYPNMIGVVICVLLYTTLVLLLGASITAGIFVFHVAVVPIIFKYSKTFRRNLVFNNNVQWPMFMDYEDVASSGLKGGRNLYIQYQSEVDGCPIRIGIWHILPQSSYERLQSTLEDAVCDKDEINRLYDEELARPDTPIFMYCHGNSCSRSGLHRVELYKFFQKMDFHTIAFDYRGFGDSSNVYPTEPGVVEDSLHVYNWVHEKIDDPRHKPVFVWGHSLGTGIASHLLGRLDELSQESVHRTLPPPRGLVLESPFNNLADEVSEHPLAKLVTWLPYYDSTFVAPFRSSPEYTFKSDEYLSKRPQLPILILHAKDDIVVPFSVGYKLYEIVTSSRVSGDAAVSLRAFPPHLALGHKWICRAPGLDHLVRQFVDDHR